MRPNVQTSDSLSGCDQSNFAVTACCSVKVLPGYCDPTFKLTDSLTATNQIAPLQLSVLRSDVTRRPRRACQTTNIIAGNERL